MILLRFRLRLLPVVWLAITCWLFCTAPWALAGTSRPAATTELQEPPVFASSHGVLDLLMVARAQTIALGDMSPTGWVYQVCARASAAGDQCPPGAATQSPYGGVRLKLQPGDHLKIRLVNQLPATPADALLPGEDEAMLASNPINLHTHGMVVEPRQSGKGDPTLGDYIYVMGYPAGKKPAMAMAGMEVTDRPIDYDVYVPRSHPAGLFWFHPHAHGQSLTQISRGLAGIITVGSVADYAAVSRQAIRHLILKDMQVRKDGTVLDRQDSSFCTTFPDPSQGPRTGLCAGALTNGKLGPRDYRGGKWFFTINGQVFPTITVSPWGEVWRLTNASGNDSYLLSLVDDGKGEKLPFQVISLNGASTDLPNGVPIPGAPVAGGQREGTTTQVLMMPGSRAEIYVPATADVKSASFTQMSYGTGPTGDAWPTVKLAKVVFTSAAPGAGATIALRDADSEPQRAAGQDLPDAAARGSRQRPGARRNAAQDDAARAHGAGMVLVAQHAHTAPTGMAMETAGATPGPECAALPAGHRRRIFFGNLRGNKFGLGYEEVDNNGDVVPGTFADLTPFEHSRIGVCLPLAPGNRAVNESWELVNVSGEDHNFHIHQTRFQVTMGPGSEGPHRPTDSVAVPHGFYGCDGTIATWRRGACQVNTVTVSIPFSEPGDFVYQCHILEHQDGGMMAHIRVAPNP